MRELQIPGNFVVNYLILSRFFRKDEEQLLLLFFCYTQV